eukprot:Seg2731.8 transcript_id=Seg2731.8/GoldUCD/mRNA.D3Y31 product="UPF0573 protein C2orf70 A" protein_id=Seg2731.8/GoldUCD/D3Y31
MEKLPLLASRLGIYEYPRHLPGYTGHCPQEKHSFGETYGNTTGSWYKNYRQTTLSNSKERLGRGGDLHVPFPIYYTHEPSLVVGTTTRTHKRWEAPERYTMHNRSGNENAIKCFKLAAEDHREQYKDKTGVLTQVPQFALPKISNQSSPRWKRTDYP